MGRTSNSKIILAKQFFETINNSNTNQPNRQGKIYNNKDNDFHTTDTSRIVSELDKSKTYVENYNKQNGNELMRLREKLTSL